MRRRYSFLAFLALVLWATVTYVLLFRTPSEPRDSGRDEFHAQLAQLEQRVERLIAENERVIGQLRAAQAAEKRKAESAAAKAGEAPSQQQDDNVGQSPPEEQQPQAELRNQTDLELLNRVWQIKRSGSSKRPIIPVLVISCNRVTVRRCLDQLIRYRPDAQQFPIFVSQDCGHQQTSKVIRSYGDAVFHLQQPDQSDIDVPPKEKKFKGYFKIARHYKWALNQVFLVFGFDAAVVVEDDLDVAPDFFQYFAGLQPVLAADPSLWCVSAWNDNGKADLVDADSPQLLYRTDFFPGLGWMLTRGLWQELAPKWPRAYWDDWIRLPEQRKDRACVRPEVPRTRTFGRIGVSNGLFYEKFLQYIKLNERPVPFAGMNLTYLLKGNYDAEFSREVYKSRVVTYAELKKSLAAGNATKEPVRIPYYTRQTYKTTAKMFGLMDDFKSGVPRTGYLGVVTFFHKGQRVYLAPGASWSGYDISWS